MVIVVVVVVVVVVIVVVSPMMVMVLSLARVVCFSLFSAVPVFVLVLAPPRTPQSPSSHSHDGTLHDSSIAALD
jgi:hypothetical protein